MARCRSRSKSSRSRSRSRSRSPSRTTPSPRRRGYTRRDLNRFGDRLPPHPTTLLVRNISRQTRAEDLRIPFERYGTVKDVYLPRDYYTGEPRGFGFVKYTNPNDAADAKYYMNHQLIDGYEISIVFAEEKRKNPEEMRLRSRRYARGGYQRCTPSSSTRQWKRSYSQSESSPLRHRSHDSSSHRSHDSPQYRSRSKSCSSDQLRGNSHDSLGQRSSPSRSRSHDSPSKVIFHVSPSRSISPDSHPSRSRSHDIPSPRDGFHDISRTSFHDIPSPRDGFHDISRTRSSESPLSSHTEGDSPSRGISRESTPFGGRHCDSPSLKSRSGESLSTTTRCPESPSMRCKSPVSHTARHGSSESPSRCIKRQSPSMNRSLECASPIHGSRSFKRFRSIIDEKIPSASTDTN